MADYMWRPLDLYDQRAIPLGDKSNALTRTYVEMDCRTPVSKHEGYQRCGACRVAVYCSKACQKRAWCSHAGDDGV